MEVMKKIPAIMAKLSAVPTKGLPEDLAAAFARVAKNGAATSEVMALIPADFPADPQAIQAYMQAHPEVMKTMMELQTKMTPLKAEGEAAEKELSEAATKHGLDVSKFINAGKALGGE
jgi:cytochrome c556